MDPETRLELIALLAQDDAWGAIVLIGRALLDEYYPAQVFTGSSGDSGPAYVVALREALERLSTGIATAGEMRAFGASHVACYRWPEDTPEHRALRAAYIEGAANARSHGPAPAARSSSA